MGTMILNRPYPPIFKRSAASTTEPAVGASTWASGSQVWKEGGHLDQEPEQRAYEDDVEQGLREDLRAWVAFRRVSISKVLDPSGS